MVDEAARLRRSLALCLDALYAVREFFTRAQVADGRIKKLELYEVMNRVRKAIACAECPTDTRFCK